ncbi:putative glutamyl-tRNA synthetase [Streptomyces scabiei 87.22]|uniref:Putative glutamyl-tRNA synthetase n=1 Tax=Streptomyces scabiei (strain 87.22) TaxID=680198 RepID=C9YW08_STRSW|nr:MULTISPECIES: glutamate--tRNA ligase [Streptomyces]MDX2658388.1 glutamate--tRNA ligase [Streptomyces scabiei]MDX2720707.1 glutamate--tRNA ligase [Streptomyces scabiei]MDX2748814.1 glutamate--tRNA ligase [Streptomyces scabiei]MDX2870846.1 glutamate--tRNA ligase [Streptomyces scabiei]MDX2891011.1 glutamate--tRNA ligase [Streptomyces scabiei]
MDRRHHQRAGVHRHLQGRSAFEGPYFQSQNADRHSEAAQQLYTQGRAYYCDCTREQLQERTGSQHLGYDGFCRDRGLEYVEGRALRFRTPTEGETVVVDLIRGEPSFPNSAIEDFVISRGDGSPVFLIANVVDDLDEGITLVIRGDEHLSNTHKQQLLWEALGAKPPVWAHLPVIVNEKRQKLSKRRDKVALDDYLAEGYLPESMTNYLMLLGWGPGDDIELRPYAELEEKFRVEDVNTSPAFFDIKKLTAFNGEYIRALPLDKFVEVCEPRTPTGRPRTSTRPRGGRSPPHAQTRVAVLSDITANVDFLFLKEPEEDEASWDKAMKGDPVALLTTARAKLETADWTSPESLKEAALAAGEEHGLKLGKAQAPVRVAVTGRTVGLPLFESLEVLGKDRTLTRIDATLAKLTGRQNRRGETSFC